MNDTIYLSIYPALTSFEWPMQLRVCALKVKRYRDPTCEIRHLQMSVVSIYVSLQESECYVVSAKDLYSKSKI